MEISYLEYRSFIGICLFNYTAHICSTCCIYLNRITNLYKFTTGKFDNKLHAISQYYVICYFILRFNFNFCEGLIA